MQNNIKTRKLITLGLFFFIFLMFFLYFLGHSFLIVATPSNTKGSTIILKKNGTPIPKKIKPGLSILSNGKYTVEISSGLSMNRKDIEIRLFHIARIGGEITPQKEAKKIARGASDCVFGLIKQAEKGSLFSYDCSSPLYIFRNDFKGFSKKTLVTNIEETSLNNPLAFKNGIVSLGAGEGGGNLIYIDNDGQKIYPLTGTVGDEDVEFYKIAVDTTKIYVLDTVNKAVFVLNDPSSKPTKITLEGLADVSRTLSSLKVFNGSLYIFSASGKQSANEDSFSEGVLYTYPLNSSKPSNIIHVKDRADDLLNFSVVSDNLVSSTSLNQNTVLYRLEKGKLGLVTTISSTSGSAVVNKELYVLIDGDIYKYNPENSVLSLEFGSEKIRVTRVEDLGSSLIFNGSSNAETSSVNQTYLLEENKPVTGDYRLEDQLPYGDIEAPISWMDYFENNIYFVPSLDSLRNSPETGNYIFSKSEFDSKSKAILQKLEKDGFTKDKYHIRFAPY